MFAKNLLIIATVSLGCGSSLADTIPLDSFASESWVLTTAERDKTLPDFVGRSPSWGVRGAQGSEALWQAVSFDPSLSPFKDGASGSIITETSPRGADKSPALRKFNLAELLDQLDLEGSLPEGVEKIPSSETGLTRFITKPTAISVSFSTYRPVRMSIAAILSLSVRPAIASLLKTPRRRPRLIFILSNALILRLSVSFAAWYIRLTAKLGFRRAAPVPMMIWRLARKPLRLSPGSRNCLFPCIWAVSLTSF